MQETNTYRPRSALNKRKSSKRQYLAILLVAIGISLLLSPPQQPARAPEKVSAISGLPTIASQQDLTIRIAQNLGDGRIGIAARDLGGGEEFVLGADRTYDAASTMKLVIVGFMYHEASNNRFDLDEVLTLAPGEIQRYGTGVIQNRPAPHRYSWRELARLMMEKSDNTAAYVLATRLDKQKLQRFADGEGMAHTSIADNTTTPRDMLRFMDRLQRGLLADEFLTEELLSILDDSEFEERIPALLPEGAKVFHKTGDAFNGGQHDVGIVRYHGKSYAVAIFTEGVSRDVDLARRKVAEASRDIFAYYRNR
ncbi:MAG: serine hydrolase [bacterium]|nr:serine hydrolase [bacterium]MDZ4248147.1 serine hydrolase [Patescibacteria group bacterium]